MDPEKIMNGISKELFAVLKAMEKAKTAEEKLMYSETAKNLSDSLGVFFDFMSDMALYDDEDESMPF
jgi:hypothetical protein